MEAAYQRGKQSVDEFVKQCAIVNPHLTLHYRLALQTKTEPAETKPEPATKPARPKHPMLNLGE